MNLSYNLAVNNAFDSSFDLLRLPVIGPLFRWKHARTFLQLPLLAISLLMIFHGLFGPSLAPKNLATVLTWLHFRGLLVLVILCAGNFFCMACPFMLIGTWCGASLTLGSTGLAVCATSGSRSLFLPVSCLFTNCFLYMHRHGGPHG
jgi:polyferredoxin